jgi:hypothetical protein
MFWRSVQIAVYRGARRTRGSAPDPRKPLLKKGLDPENFKKTLIINIF